jgi:hypothetical protein
MELQDRDLPRLEAVDAQIEIPMDERRRIVVPPFLRESAPSERLKLREGAETGAREIGVTGRRRGATDEERQGKDDGEG